MSPVSSVRTAYAINDAVIAYGSALLDGDLDRIGAVEALGVDEVLFGRFGRWRTQAWSTQIVDVARGQLLDVIPGRSAAGLCEWLEAQPVAWLDGIARGDAGSVGPVASGVRHDAPRSHPGR